MQCCVYTKPCCVEGVSLGNKIDNDHLSVCLQPSFLPPCLLSYVLGASCYKQVCFKLLCNIGLHRMHIYSGVFKWPLEPKNCPFLCSHHGEDRTGHLLSSAKLGRPLRTTLSQWYLLLLSSSDFPFSLHVIAPSPVLTSFSPFLSLIFF